MLRIRNKNTSTVGKIPLTTDLELGELAVNTSDGILYLKKNQNNVESIVALQTLTLLQNTATVINTATGVINIGSGLTVATDENNVSTIQLDGVLPELSNLNVVGDAVVGGNFTASGSIFAIGAVFSNGTEVLTAQAQPDWNQENDTLPSYINNKPGLILSTLYTKQLIYIGTIETQVGVIRWYPDTNIVITKAILNASVPPTSGDFEIQINKNGLAVGSISLLVNEYVSTPVTLNIAALTTDYITVDVISGGLAGNGALSLTFTRTST